MIGNFSKCFWVTEAFEGWHKFSNNPKDPGGATYSGVTQRVWDAYCKLMGKPYSSVKAMPDTACLDIYQRQYWDVIQGDKLPLGVDLVVYDAGVNSGNVQAIKFLQRAIGVKADGHIGLVTLHALAGVNDHAALIKSITNLRLSFWHRLRTWAVFQKGWTARGRGVEATALTMLSLATA